MMHRPRFPRTTWMIGLAVGVIGVLGFLFILTAPLQSKAQSGGTNELTDPGYVVLAWNDLGMHCYNANFRYMSILPPANFIWAQVIRLGDPPEIVTSGIRVTYSIVDNTYSVGKSNFWDHAAHLGYNVAPNVGIFGFGLSGEMRLDGNHFIAEGIPLTEYTDSAYQANPSNPTPNPYQLGTVTVWDAVTGEKLAETQPTVPVSTEMNCDDCHYDGGVEGIATGSVELNILTLHDQENEEGYPPQFAGGLVANAPVQCADCHGSNALNIPGLLNLPDVSTVMHDKHAEAVPSTLEGCYECHPGPKTQCLRGVMSWKHDLTCPVCHRTMQDLAQKTQPWLQEPRCDDPTCHGPDFAQNNPLYRMSTGHGDVYCEGCHDSPHAIAPSRVVTDSIKFVGWQGHNGPIDSCVVCHTTVPAGAGPHGLTAPSMSAFTFQPASLSMLVMPGEQAIYTHRLRNTGNVSDTYAIASSDLRGWTVVALSTAGGPATSPVTLDAGELLTVTVTVSAPGNPGLGVAGDTTTVTATSTVAPPIMHTVVDVTRIVRSRTFLPLVLRNF